MNNKIREAAEKKYPYDLDQTVGINSYNINSQNAFQAGATFALKEIEQLREAAKEVVNNLERDDEPALMDNLRAALSATESYFETDKI